MTDPARHRIAEEGGEMSEMKPCPFCGSSDVEQRQSITDAVVACNNCGCRTGFVFLGASEAENAAKMREQRDLWNTRAAIEALGGEQVRGLVPVNRRVIGERED